MSSKSYRKEWTVYKGRNRSVEYAVMTMDICSCCELEWTWIPTKISLSLGHQKRQNNPPVMDTEAVLIACLSIDKDIRSNGELALKGLSRQPSHVLAVLQLVYSSEDVQVWCGSLDLSMVQCDQVHT